VTVQASRMMNHVTTAIHAPTQTHVREASAEGRPSAPTTAIPARSAATWSRANVTCTYLAATVQAGPTAYHVTTAIHAPKGTNVWAVPARALSSALPTTLPVRRTAIPSLASVTCPYPAVTVQAGPTACHVTTAIPVQKGTNAREASAEGRPSAPKTAIPARSAATWSRANVTCTYLAATVQAGPTAYHVTTAIHALKGTNVRMAPARGLPNALPTALPARRTATSSLAFVTPIYPAVTVQEGPMAYLVTTAIHALKRINVREECAMDRPSVHTTATHAP